MIFEVQSQLELALDLELGSVFQKASPIHLLVLLMMVLLVLEHLYHLDHPLLLTHPLTHHPSSIPRQSQVHPTAVLMVFHLRTDQLDFQRRRRHRTGDVHARQQEVYPIHLRDNRNCILK